MPAELIAKAFGLLKRAEVPLASVVPVEVAPATVVTTPVEATILRIWWLPVSATYKLAPAASTTIPAGELNRAAAPVPLVLPADPAVPARVVTVPLASIFRITWLAVSAT